MMHKKTIVLGASPNPSRYSYIATQRLQQYGHEVLPIGVRKGSIANMPIINDPILAEEVDTITLYLNPQRQENYYDYIFQLHPKRVIFNPGTENPAFIRQLKEKGIETEIACTLVLLSVGEY